MATTGPAGGPRRLGASKAADATGMANLRANRRDGGPARELFAVGAAVAAFFALAVRPNCRRRSPPRAAGWRKP